MNMFTHWQPFAVCSTVGTRLSEHQLSEYRLSDFSIIRMRGRNHFFSSSRKRRSGHWNSATGESKAAV